MYCTVDFTLLNVAITLKRQSMHMTSQSSFPPPLSFFGGGGLLALLGPGLGMEDASFLARFGPPPPPPGSSALLTLALNILSLLMALTGAAEDDDAGWAELPG